MKKISIYIVDDHQMLIDGIKALLADVPEFHIVGEALRCSDALASLAQQDVDIVLTDVNMPEMDGQQLTSAIKRFKPEQKIIALTMFGEKTTIKDMIDAGASGYILKNTGKAELVKALYEVACGNKYFSEEVAQEMEKEDVELDKRYMLTLREREIIKLVARGLSHTVIGEKLCISPRTVDTHRTNIMKKLEVASIAELIKVALQLKIID